MEERAAAVAAALVAETVAEVLVVELAEIRVGVSREVA